MLLMLPVLFMLSTNPYRSVKVYLLADTVLGTGIQGPPRRSTEFQLGDFDALNNVNYRGLWLCGRAQLAQMLKQNPLQTHDGRPGNRGAIVHIASQLGVVSRSNAGEYWHSVCSIRAKMTVN